MSTEPATGYRHRPAARAAAPWPLVPLIALQLVATAAVAADALAGLTLPQLIERIERTGVSIYYSSDLVKPWMRVRDEPDAAAPEALLREVLAPYGLTVTEGPDRAWLIVRDESHEVEPAGDDRSAVAAASGAVEPREEPLLEEVVVHASRYQLSRRQVASAATLNAAELELVPELGDDALRTVARLPGMASSDFTAKSNVRGGVADETLVRFDDLRLYNPFHLKDFLSPFSAIDPRLIRGIDAYAGGFPAHFGDRMSGVLDIESIVPLDRTRREIAVSFFNVSALLAGTFDDAAGDWLVSGRRGNLDLLIDAIDPSLGRPSYTELHAHLSRRLTPTLEVAGNVLRLEDDILLYDSDQEENARANYRDTYYWLRFDHEPGDSLSGTWLLSHSSIASERRGDSDLPGVSSGSLRDDRDARIDAIQGDWVWRVSPSVLTRFGFEWRHMRADYRYEDQVEFDLLIDAPGASTETGRRRVVSVHPAGDIYGAYASLRVEPSPGLFVEGGLRWDRETLSTDGGDCLSPRLNVAYSLTEQTTLRAGWGRFVQPQDVTELPVSDGIDRFDRPQRSDHLVAGLEHRFTNDTELRIEAYRKTYDRLRPRYENLLNTFVLLPELKPDRVRIAPLDATATGIEVSLRRRTDGPLAWYVAYAWSRAEDRTAEAKVSRSWDQSHSVSAVVTWQQTPWDLSLAARYHSGWPTTALELAETEPVPVATAGPRNALRLRPFLSIDARIARTFTFDSAGTLTLFAEVTNLLNRSNDCCVEYEMEDEDEGLVLDVGRLEALPAIPSLGFIWQF